MAVNGIANAFLLLSKAVGLQLSKHQIFYDRLRDIWRSVQQQILLLSSIILIMIFLNEARMKRLDFISWRFRLILDES